MNSLNSISEWTNELPVCMPMVWYVQIGMVAFGSSFVVSRLRYFVCVYGIFVRERVYQLKKEGKNISHLLKFSTGRQCDTQEFTERISMKRSVAGVSSKKWTYSWKIKDKLCTRKIEKSHTTNTTKQKEIPRRPNRFWSGDVFVFVVCDILRFIWNESDYCYETDTQSSTHPRGESIACSFFDFLNLFHHFYFLWLVRPPTTSGCALSKERKFERSTARHPGRKREFPTKTNEKIFQVFWTCLIYLFIYFRLFHFQGLRFDSVEFVIFV